MPESVHLNLTYRCNLDCVFCVTGGSRPGSDLPYPALERGLEQARARGAVAVNLCGGEPTLYPDLLKLVARARELGYRHIALKTNGVRLKDRGFVDDLVEAGVNHFSVSLHGSSVVHDRLTRTPGSFAAAARGLDHVRGRGVRLSLPTCIFAPNHALLPETLSVLGDFAPAMVMPTFAEPNGRCDTAFEDLTISYADVRDPLARGLDLILARGVAVCLINFPYCTVRGYERYSLDTHSQVVHLLDDAGALREDFRETERPLNRAKGPPCCGCNFDGVCSGPFRAYVERRGWGDIAPITDLRVLDVIPLARILGHELAARRRSSGPGGPGGAGGGWR